jgi:hypothetical protein
MAFVSCGYFVFLQRGYGGNKAINGRKGNALPSPVPVHISAFFAICIVIGSILHALIKSSVASFSVALTPA